MYLFIHSPNIIVLMIIIYVHKKTLQWTPNCHIYFVCATWRHREYFIICQLDFYTKYCGYKGSINIYICFLHIPSPSFPPSLTLFLPLPPSIDRWIDRYRYLYVCIFIYLLLLFLKFIYFWLCWVFVATHGLSLVAASGGYSSLRCVGFSLRWLLLLQSTGSRHAGSVVVARGLQSAGSVVVAHGLSCFTACGIFPDQGSNPCPRN